MNGPLLAHLLATLAGGAASRLGSGSILALGAALAPNPELVEPGLDVPDGELVEPLASEVRHDVKPGEELVVVAVGTERLPANPAGPSQSWHVDTDVFPDAASRH